jgi:hypothetical protein
MKRFNWCWIHELVVATNELDLISILTAFVREKRRATNETSIRDSNKYRRDKDSTWTNKLYVSVHAFLTCWVRNENDSLNLNKLIEEKVRCKSQWQNKDDEWRRDFVWVQEEVVIESDSSNFFQSKFIEQLQIIMIIIDLEQLDSNHRSMRYYEVFLNIWKSRNKEKSNEISEMIDIKSWSQSVFRNFRFLRFKRIYDVSAMIKSVHVMSNDKNDYYVNNYANWDIYNTVYDEDFLNKRTRRAKTYSRTNVSSRAWSKSS